MTALNQRVTELERELARGGDVQERITGLEERIEEVAAAHDTLADLDRIEETEEELVRLVDALTVLEEDLDVLAEGSGALEEEVRETTGDLRSVLDEVRAGVDELRAENDELRTLIETVRDRLDRCQADGSC